MRAIFSPVMIGKLAWLLFVILFGMISQAEAVVESKKLNQVMNIMVLTEGITSTIVSLHQDETVISCEIEWDGTASDSIWTVTVAGTMNGKQLKAEFSGLLIRSDNEAGDIIVSFNGWGKWGSKYFTSIGGATWPYDKAIKDYPHLKIAQLTKIGSNSVWGWITAAEAIVGGSIGAGAGIIVGTPTSPVGQIIIGTKAAMEGAAVALGISVAAKALVEQDVPPPKPDTPNVSTKDFKPDQIVPPSEDRILTAVDHNGAFKIIHSNLFYGDGNFEGNTIHAKLNLVKIEK